MLGDDAGAPLAALGGLRALHLGSTGAGDGLVEALMFRLRLEAWCRKSGARRMRKPLGAQSCACLSIASVLTVTLAAHI